MAQIPLQETQLNRLVLVPVCQSSVSPSILSTSLCSVAGSFMASALYTADSSCLLQLHPSTAKQAHNSETISSHAVSCKTSRILPPLKSDQLHSTLPAMQPMPVLSHPKFHHQQQQVLNLHQQQQNQGNDAAKAPLCQSVSAAGSLCSKLPVHAYSLPLVGAVAPVNHAPTAAEEQAYAASTQHAGAQDHTHCYNTRMQQRRQRLLQLLQHQKDQLCTAAAAVELLVGGAQQPGQQLLQQHAAAAATAARYQIEEAAAAACARRRAAESVAAVLAADRQAARAATNVAGHSELAALTSALLFENGSVKVAAVEGRTQSAACHTAAAAVTHTAKKERDDVCIGNANAILVNRSATHLDASIGLNSGREHRQNVMERATKRRHSRSSSRTLYRAPSLSSSAAAAVAQEALRQSVLLQVLCKAAAVRKGTAVLTAGPGAAAAAAGAESVRGRLLITELAVYSKTATQLQRALIGRSGTSSGCSAADLQLANKMMARIALPGGVTYMPVKSDSRIFCSGASWRMPAFAICLASSYMQRLMAQQPVLAAAAAGCIGFQDYAHHMPPEVTVPQLTRQQSAEAVISLRICKCICLFLALKVADSVHALGLLRFMISQVTGNAAPTQSDVEAFEITVLNQLDWRLGPFFAEDAEVVPGVEERMWAEAVLHCWDY